MNITTSQTPEPLRKGYRGRGGLRSQASVKRQKPPSSNIFIEGKKQELNQFLGIKPKQPKVEVPQIEMQMSEAPPELTSPSVKL